MTLYKRYVVGLVFSVSRRSVLLIEKQRPDWQRGLLNGIGGAVEMNQTLIEAMVAETREEAGLNVPAESWTHFAQLHGRDWRVHFFSAFTNLIFEGYTTTDEKVGWYNVRSLDPKAAVPDLAVFIQLALDQQHFVLPVDLLDHSRRDHADALTCGEKA